MTATLFGHLAFSFASSPENMATEALAYILSSSHAARAAFCKFVSQGTLSLPESLYFETQVGGEDDAQPDLVGFDSLRRPVLIIEAKFWAGLTSNQPSTYIKRLLSSPDGVVLFIAPQRRLTGLWPEIIARCNPAPAAPVHQATPGIGLIAASLTDHHAIALTSWKATLGAVRVALEAEHDLRALSDLSQLEGLCQRMDEEAFLPIRTEELGPEIARRIINYCGLVDELAKALVDRQLVPKEGVNSGASAGQYRRYMFVATYACNLQFSADWWASHRETPLWFQIQDKGYKFPSGAKEALSFLEARMPPGILITKDSVLVPLALPTRQERPEVVQALLAQLAEVIARLRSPRADDGA
jgi:hypothetical protein